MGRFLYDGWSIYTVSEDDGEGLGGEMGAYPRWCVGKDDSGCDYKKF